MHLFHYSTSCRTRRFTLVELMMAMAVLSLLLLLLTRYITTTQRTWQLNQGQQDMLESKRVALEVIERDLNAAIASSVQGQEIGFYIADPETDGFTVAFVASVPYNTDADSRLCEIYYRQQGDQLLRMIVPASSSTWDFFGETTTGTPDWVLDNQPDNSYETLLHEGVLDFNMAFFSGGNDTTPITGQTTVFNLPQRADIELLLYDADLPNPTPENIDLTKRSFISIIYLNKLIPRPNG